MKPNADKLAPHPPPTGRDERPQDQLIADAHASHDDGIAAQGGGGRCTPRQIAARWNCSDQTVLNYIGRGMPVADRIEKLRQPTRYLLDPVVCERWKAQHVGPTDGITGHGGKRPLAGRKKTGRKSRARARASAHALPLLDAHSASDPTHTDPTTELRGRALEQWRLDRLKADKLEIEMRTLLGELVSKKKITDDLTRAMADIRGVLDRFSFMVAPKVMSLAKGKLDPGDQVLIQRLIDEQMLEVYDRLLEIADKVGLVDKDAPGTTDRTEIAA